MVGLPQLLLLAGMALEVWSQGQGPPDPVAEVKIAKVTSTSFVAHWRKPTGGRIIGYSVDVEGPSGPVGNYDSPANMCDALGRCSRTVEALTPDTELVVKVSAYSPLGSGPFSAPVNVRTLLMFKSPWILGESAPANAISLWHTSNQTDVDYSSYTPLLFVSVEGEVWSSQAQGYLAVHSPKDSMVLDPHDPNKKTPAKEAVGRLDLGARAVGWVFTSGPWDIGPTNTGALGFNYRDVLRFVIMPDGRLYSQSGEGFCVGRAPLGKNHTTSQREQYYEEQNLLRMVDQVLQEPALLPGTTAYMGKWRMGQHEQSGAFAFNHAKRTELSDGSFHDYQTQVIIFPNGVIWAVNNGKPSFFVRQMFAPRVLQIKPTTLVPTVMVDCEVGLWSTFSVCNRNCNTGTKQRFRSVVQTPMNNGAYCPQLSDGYACAEEPCKCRNINLPKFDGALLLQASGTEPTLLMWFKTKVVQIALTQTNLHNPGDLIEWRLGIVGEEFFLAPPFKGLAAPFDGGMGSPIPKGPPVGSSEEVFLTAYGSWAGWRRSDFKTTFPTRKLKGAMWWKKIPQVCRDSVDGAVMNGWNEWSSSECVLLWCGNSWLRMNTINFEIVEGPFESKKKPWSYSVPAPFNSRIDAAFTMPDSMEAYLFSGIWGVRWDPTEDTILEGPFLLTNHTLFHKVSDALGICPPDL